MSLTDSGIAADGARTLRNLAAGMRANADRLDQLAGALDHCANAHTALIPAEELLPGDRCIFDDQALTVSGLGHPDIAVVEIDWAHDGQVINTRAYPAVQCFTVALPRPPAPTDAELLGVGF